LVDQGLKTALPSDAEERALEERARTEKAAALEQLFRSRIAVLIGPAGTGKTTLLRMLCALPADRVESRI
jgi:putative ribosome biogenesis GTPase RsgA